MKFAKRLDAVPPYLFAELERKVTEAEKAGVDVISLGIGDPDLPTPPAVIDALAEAARDPRTHQYPTNHGTEEFRAAAADFYGDRFGVELDPNGEVIPVLGGKEGVGHIALACLDPGDVCLAPDPGYPPYTSGPVFAGATVHYLPLREENGFLPDLDGAPDAKLLYLNYPNNPTGATAELDFFAHAIDVARERDLIVVHDNAYSEVAFDGYRPPSFLEADGAKEVGVEIFSLSKGWNMTGWRAGLVAGNRRDRRALPPPEDEPRLGHVRGRPARGRGRAHRSSGSSHGRSPRSTRGGATCSPRGCERSAWTSNVPRATPYFWIAVPEGHTSASFTELVLEQASVLVSPGDAYGPSGEGYVRLSLTVPDSRLEEAVDRITRALVIIQS